MNLEDLPIETVSAHRAVELVDASIEVADREERLLGPSGELKQGFFRWAEVNSFEDLKVLGLIPNDVDHERLAAAVREDIRASAAVAGEQPRGCQPPPGVLAAPPKVHDALRSVMRETVTYEIHDQHPALLKVNAVVTRFISDRLRVIGVASLQNITIGAHGKLTFTPSVSVLRANEITIGDEGRLQFLGKGITVRANTLNGSTRVPSSTPVNRSRPVGWLSELRLTERKG